MEDSPVSESDEPQVDREEILGFLKASLPKVSGAKLAVLCDHLIGPTVECYDLQSLKDVAPDTYNGFIGSAQISRLKRKIEELPGENCYQGAKRTQGTQGTSGNKPAPIIPDDPSQFRYKIDWNVVSSNVLTKLQEADENNTVASDEDYKELKLSLAKDLKMKWNLHRVTYPGKFKHPGETFYQMATDQVFEKFKCCLREEIREKVISDGKASFLKVFGECVENQMRDTKAQATKSRVIDISRRSIGALPDQFNPVVQNEEDQIKIRDYLINLHSTGRPNWDLEEIRNKSKETFELQRKDIDIATDEVHKNKNGDSVPVNERAVSKLKDKWPLLFEPMVLEDHFFRLTGFGLTDKLDLFYNEAESLIEFMTTAECCPAIKNLKLQKNFKALNDNRPGSQLFLVISMIANCFQENMKKGMIQSVEITTPVNDVIDAASDLPPTPYLISRGSIYNAESYCVAVDSVLLVEVSNAPQAFTTVYALNFVLGTDYCGSLKYTLEFIERIIFQMQLSALKSKPAKKRASNVVMSGKVKDFIESYDKFKEEVNKIDDDD